MKYNFLINRFEVEQALMPLLNRGISFKPLQEQLKNMTPRHFIIYEN